MKEKIEQLSKIVQKNIERLRVNKFLRYEEDCVCV